MARMITNYEKHKDRVIASLRGDVASVGCIYQDLTGGDCPTSGGCKQCAKLFADFLQEETEHPLSEKEIMFCRIAETGCIERRPNGTLFLFRYRNGEIATANDITFLDIFDWLEAADESFNIEEYLKQEGSR